MTERTHDMAALTMLTLAFVVLPLTPVTLVTLIALVLANQFGSAFPDLDQPTAEFYQELPASSFFGHLLSPLMGSHRHISHSILGIALYSWLFHLLLSYLGKFLTADMNFIWWAFVLGYISHLIMDTLTKEGVPWLFPLPIKFGFPPFYFLRVTTGKFAEKILVYPALAALNCYLVYLHYPKVTEFFSHYLIK